MKPIFSKIIWAVAILAAAYFFYQDDSKSPDIAVVTRIVDGDTLEIAGGSRVRLIGVDTPEYHDRERDKNNAKRLGISVELYERYARDAAEFVRDLAAGQTIRLEYDSVNNSIKHRDKYGRLLAYVWLQPPFLNKAPAWAVMQAEEFYSLSLNGSLVKAGYSFANSRFFYERKDIYATYEKDARINKRGFWQSASQPIN